MNETVRMIREMTGITRTQLNTATRTLTVRSNEQNVALAQTCWNRSSSLTANSCWTLRFWK